jgi:hypothetical protein
MLSRNTRDRDRARRHLVGPRRAWARSAGTTPGTLNITLELVRGGCTGKQIEKTWMDN